MSPNVVSRDEWLKARKDLLIKEKAATRAQDALDAELRGLPMVKLENDYKFDGPNGQVGLADLFDGRKQLVVYHFMLGPGDTAPCTGCAFLADNLPANLSHLKSRKTSLVLISRAPFAVIEKVKKKMGWEIPWYSSLGSDFNYDFHVTLDESIAPFKGSDEMKSTIKGDLPGLSVFSRDEGTIYHTYSTYARGLDRFLVTHKLLDVTPLGRQDDENGDWKLHDEY
ncbi:hypothetical protein B0O99DRAFT_692038 [Bisporella sp. PMI_857]|nr:hypothetical protein B0O99DRAFT_692038 [Bisporella sp. PMI_857]